jgi:uncharacterized protein YbbK (DUF523 family)
MRLLHRDLERAERLRRALPDARGGRVLFVAHCLLNENVRYLGGATRSGAVDEVVQAALESGVGLVQLPCPEQQTWGGVLKPLLLAGYARDRGWAARRLLRHAAADGLAAYSRARFRRLAAQVADLVADYQQAGMEVVGIVGIGASPSCGVACTLDLRRSVDVVAPCPLATITPDLVNRAVGDGVRPGAGLFVAELRAALRRRGVPVRFFEHDLLRELEGGVDLPPGLAEALA